MVDPVERRRAPVASGAGGCAGGAAIDGPAQKRFQAERGRLCGWGVTKPRRFKIRQIVEMAGTLVMLGSLAR
jgi:hypothetical protein